MLTVIEWWAYANVVGVILLLGLQAWEGLT